MRKYRQICYSPITILCLNSSLDIEENVIALIAIQLYIAFKRFYPAPTLEFVRLQRLYWASHLL